MRYPRSIVSLALAASVLVAPAAALHGTASASTVCGPTPGDTRCPTSVAVHYVIVNNRVVQVLRRVTTYNANGGSCFTLVLVNVLGGQVVSTSSQRCLP
jgi:hypothetical protein